ncbi:glycosyltransferase family 4 protein [Scytonema tolypothrichoides VB-61278]|nr:glycosyltransferase family 4 protein [Scytonema tolypothrichoides VB-61278]
MKILHVGSSSSPKAVDGVNATVWLVAKEQAFLGHQVTLMLDSPPDEAAKILADEAGFQLMHIPANTWRYDPNKLKSLLHTDTPSIVHMHSVYLPKQATLARKIVQNQIPYVITPHGGLDSLRGKAKKFFYDLIAEKRRFSQASAITVVTPKEERTIRAFMPRYQGIIRWVASPFDTSKFSEQIWKGNIEAKRLVFLGRYDVLHKGIDILVEIARLLPDIEFDLYGTEDSKTKKWLEKIRHNCPCNVHFNKPIFGAEKFQVLADASFYIQTSRWEGFPVSIAESMYMGLPCAVSDLPNFAELFHQNDLGLVLPANPTKAAQLLTEAFAQPIQVQHWSKSAQTFAKDNFHPRKVALDYLKIYEDIAA